MAKSGRPHSASSPPSPSSERQDSGSVRPGPPGSSRRPSGGESRSGRCDSGIRRFFWSGGSAPDRLRSQLSLWRRGSVSYQWSVKMAVTSSPREQRLRPRLNAVMSARGSMASRPAAAAGGLARRRQTQCSWPQLSSALPPAFPTCPPPPSRGLPAPGCRPAGSLSPFLRSPSHCPPALSPVPSLLVLAQLRALSGPPPLRQPPGLTAFPHPRSLPSPLFLPPDLTVLTSLQWSAFPF